MTAFKYRDRENVGRTAERKFAKRVSGRQTVASGGGLSGDKGDVEVDNFLIEVKATEGVTFRIEKAWLDKIADEATQVVKIPALAIQFAKSNGEVVLNGSWVMVKENFFVEICAKYKESKA